uniref:Uncharacterized protein n=1 Tax=Anguilla anguilla TaxID=7936 RepID=A0A0E9X2Q8_ANGAN
MIFLHPHKDTAVLARLTHNLIITHNQFPFTLLNISIAISSVRSFSLVIKLCSIFLHMQIIYH